MFLCFDNRFRCGNLVPESKNYYDLVVPLIKTPGTDIVTLLPIISLTDKFFHGFHINDLIFYPRKDRDWYKENESTLATKPVYTFATSKQPTVLYVCMKTNLVQETNVEHKLPKSVRAWLRGI